MRKPAICILLLLLLALHGVCAASIQVVEEQGADPALLQNVRQVTEAFDAVMLHEMNVTVTQNVKVFVTPGRESYANVMQRELGQDKEAAERSARLTSGFSSSKKQAVALNGDASQMKRLGGVTSVVAHELFHQIQGQLEGADRYRLYWMSEGTADYVGALVADRLGVLDLDGWKKQRINIIRKNPSRASPQEITDLSLSQWTTLMEQKKSPYEMADLMVIFLLEQSNKKGPAAIAEYFRQCSKLHDGKAALTAAFGVDSPSFPVRFSAWLNSLLAQGGSVEISAAGPLPTGWTSEAQDVSARLSAILAQKWNIHLLSTLRILLSGSADGFAKALTHEFGIAANETEKMKAETWHYAGGVAVIQAGYYTTGQARALVVSEVMARMWFADALPVALTDRLPWMSTGGVFYATVASTDALFPGTAARQREIWLKRLIGEIPNLSDLSERALYNATAKRLGSFKVEAVSGLAATLLLEKYGEDSYGKWLAGAKEKGDARIAFTAVYGRSWETFADEFQAWLMPRLKKAS